MGDMVTAAKQCRECHGVPSPNVCPMCTGAGTVALPTGPENLERYYGEDPNLPRTELLIARAEMALDRLRNNRYSTYGSDGLRLFDSGMADMTVEMQEEWLSMRSKHEQAALRKHLKTSAPGLPQEITNLILNYSSGEARLTAYEVKYPEVFLDAMEILVETARVATSHFVGGDRYGSTISISSGEYQLHPDFAAAMDANE